MKVCVIGAGEAGRRAALEAALDGASVSVVDAGERPLPDWRTWPDLIGGSDARGRAKAGEDLGVYYGTRISSISGGSAKAQGGRSFNADAFVVATGAGFEPTGLEGRRKAGVTVMDSAGRYLEFSRAAASAARPAVTGEGWRGLEVAERLAKWTKSVALFVSFWQEGGPGPSALGVITSAAMERGVTVVGGGASRALGIRGVEAVLSGGRVFPADALAVLPRRTPRPAQSPAPLGAGGAILVGLDARSGADGILAAGSCAALVGRFRESPLNQRQAASGRVAGANASGRQERLSATRRQEWTGFGLVWTRVQVDGEHGPASSRHAQFERAWSERTSCSLTFERRGGAVVAVEMVEDLRRSGPLAACLSGRPTLRSLAYDGSATSSDISLISDTARLGLKAWSGS